MASQQPGHQATGRDEIPGNYEPVVNQHFQAPAHNLDSKQAEQIIRLAESSHKDAQGGAAGNFGKRDHHGQSASEFAGPNAGLSGLSGSHSHGTQGPSSVLGGDVHGRREHHGMSSSEFSGPADPIGSHTHERSGLGGVPATALAGSVGGQRQHHGQSASEFAGAAHPIQQQAPSYPSQAGNVGADRTHHGMSASEYLPPSGTGVANTKSAPDVGRALHNSSTYTDKPSQVTGVSHPQIAAVEPGSATSTAHYDLTSMGQNAGRSGHEGHLHSNLATGAGVGAGAGLAGAGVASAAHQTPMHPTGQTGSTGHSGLAQAAGTTGATAVGTGAGAGLASGAAGHHTSSTTGGEQSIADKLRGELERNAQKSGTHASGLGTHGAAKNLNA